jgi:glycosyltransferase involved in cell wall biosynthesis
MQNLRVALLNHEFPPVPSGVGSYTYDLAYNLAKHMDVTVITGNYGNEDQFENKNGKLHIYKLSTPSLTPRFVWFQLKNREKIRRILEKDKIDVFHGQGTACAFLLSDSFFPKPKIVTHHGDPRLDFAQFYMRPFRQKFSGELFQYGLAYPLWYYISKREYDKADKVTTFTQFIAKNLQKTFGTPKDITVIPQGIDLDKILETRKGGCIEKDNSIFFSGRLIWRKGILFLLKAFERVHRDIPDLKLKIFGDGPLKGMVQNFIKTKKLEKTIVCYGYVSYSTLIEEICKSHFAVLPSLFEASSILMLEVMACKRTFIAFDLPFLKEQFTHLHNAYLTPVDETELAKAIVELYRNESLREKLEEAAYPYVATSHNWSTLVNEYIKLYESLSG